MEISASVGDLVADLVADFVVCCFFFPVLSVVTMAY
jgi:hypothetical protein